MSPFDFDKTRDDAWTLLEELLAEYYNDGISPECFGELSARLRERFDEVVAEAGKAVRDDAEATVMSALHALYAREDFAAAKRPDRTAYGREFAQRCAEVAAEVAAELENWEP